MKHANVMNLKTGKGRGLGTASDDLGSALKSGKCSLECRTWVCYAIAEQGCLGCRCKNCHRLQANIPLKPPYSVEPLYAMVAISNYPPCFNRTPPLTFILLYIYGKKETMAQFLNINSL